MFQNGPWTAAAAVIALAAAAAPAAAITLPPSVDTFTLTEQYPRVANYNDALLTSNSYRNDTDIFGFDSVFGYTTSSFNSAGPGIGLTVIGGGSGEISMKYYFEIGGPVGQDVKIGMAGSVYAFGFPDPDPGTAFASVVGSLALPLGGDYAEGCDSNEGGCPVGLNSGTTTFNDHFMVPTNTLEWVYLDVSVDSQDYGAEFVAQADPIITLEVDDPQDYQILVSPDETNGSPAPVPEPLGWALMIVGVGVIGADFRSRRSRGQVKLGAASNERRTTASSALKL